MRKSRQYLLQGLLVIVAIILINVLASGWFFRWDLTAEKRYSLNPVTIETLDSLELPLFVTVYLEGEFPPNIRRFQEAIRTTLIEFEQYADGQIKFDFSDPSNNRELLADFQQRGYVPVPIRVRVSTTETRQQFMWPLVTMRYRDREVTIDLLKGAAVMTTQGPNVDFGKAEADLEYKLVSAMRSLIREQAGVVAILQGHGEHTPAEIGEWLTEIQNSYAVFTFDMDQNPGLSISPTIDVLIIAQPKEAFSEREKYEIDQYLMRGGSILWVLDLQTVDLDIYRKQSTMTSLRELNLDDMFMRYGFKLNYDLIQDLESERTEVFVEGPGGGSFSEEKWPFYPLVYSFPNTPVNRNVDAVLLRYASSIDTFTVEGLHHQPFLLSSRLSRKLDGRQFIDLNSLLNEPPPPSIFNQGPLIAGNLTEGVFTSLFLGRDIPVDSVVPELPREAFVGGSRVRRPEEGYEDYRQRVMASDFDPDVKDRLLRLTDERSIAIIADGEFPLGKSFRGERQFMPYDNKTLLMNLVDYLAGDPALVQIRSKQIVERRLSREKVQENATLIRILNLVLPVVLIIGFGVFRSWNRRRRYARNPRNH